MRFRNGPNTDDEALRLLRELATRHSTDKFILRNLGLVLRAKGQEDEALACFDRGAALPGGIWSTPAYFNGVVYYGDVSGTLKAFTLSGAKLVATPQSQSAAQFTYPGTAPSVSANGTSNGIVWAHENTNPAVLHAYDAGNLAHELYSSNQAATGRDHFGAGNKYITPTVADGKVFVGTTHGVAIFGLLP